MVNQKQTKSKSKITLKKRNRLSPLFFTFLGTFMLFFFTFTVLLPIFTPEVEIPALTDEHSINSVTSNDFKGRIDPRLNEIEREESAPPKLKMEIPEGEEQILQEASAFDKEDLNAEITEKQPKEPKNTMPWEKIDPDYKVNNSYNMNIKTYDEYVHPESKNQKASDSITNQLQTANLSNISSRRIPLPGNNGRVTRLTSKAKVILGSYATPMQARLVSDALIDIGFNVAPFIKEQHGRYFLQAGSFSDYAKADELAKSLKSRGFNAKIVYE